MSIRKSAVTEGTRYSAPALEKGLDVLELLAAEPHGLNLQEISRRLKRTSNELFRMLDVLLRRGYDEGPSDTINGVVDICFPIFDRFGVIAALNIVYLKQRDSRVTIPAAREKLRHTAQAISKALGWLTGEARMKGDG